MKLRTIIFLSLFAAAVACQTDKTSDIFTTEGIEFDVEAVGGVVSRVIPSDARWIASTDNAWITVSPANGRGTTECKFIVDSALTTTARRGVVRIENLELKAWLLIGVRARCWRWLGLTTHRAQQHHNRHNSRKEFSRLHNNVLYFFCFGYSNAKSSS